MCLTLSPNMQLYTFLWLVTYPACLSGWHSITSTSTLVERVCQECKSLFYAKRLSTCPERSRDDKRHNKQAKKKERDRKEHVMFEQLAEVGPGEREEKGRGRGEMLDRSVTGRKH